MITLRAAGRGAQVAVKQDIPEAEPCRSAAGTPPARCSQLTGSQSFGAITTFGLWRKDEHPHWAGRKHHPRHEGPFGWEASRACRRMPGLTPCSYENPRCQAPSVVPRMTSQHTEPGHLGRSVAEEAGAAQSGAKRSTGACRRDAAEAWPGVRSGPRPTRWGTRLDPRDGAARPFLAPETGP